MVHYAAVWLILFLLIPYNFEIHSTERLEMEDNISLNKKLNRLAGASSPYLQAHADNPVDWYPWGKEAFEKAQREDKPIFLSIGYNACHWCHIMERESFENQEIAALLNRKFVSIKVDREERPDIDQVYMSAVTAMTGSGGWPMTVFMTPDKNPFFAGTYFPPETKWGRPGFKEILTELSRAYSQSRYDIIQSARSIADHLVSNSQARISPRSIDPNVIKSAAEALYASLDRRHGGFGTAPKFPQPVNLSLFFRTYYLTGNEDYAEAAFLSLRKMAEGGIYDYLGGGFHRYSIDERWLVPHFEKMLYDNALLVIPYLEAYQISADHYYLDVVHGILGYLQAEMTHTTGGIYSTQDADSEGEEGRYYTWTKKEVEQVLGQEAEWFCKYFDISEEGNFEHGRSILNIGYHSETVREDLKLDKHEFAQKLLQAKEALLEVRRTRIVPATDDKILASWNGLAISAFAQAFQVTGRESYLSSAQKATNFILSAMVSDGILYHSYRQGNLLKVELLEDYAYFVAGLIDLYQATFDETYLDQARNLARRAVERFSENDEYYLSPPDDTDLIYRPRDLTDGATPSPSSVMILNLLRLGKMTGDRYFSEHGRAALEAVSGLAARIPQATCALLLAGYFDLVDPVEIVVSGRDPAKMREFNREIFSRFIPNKVIAGSVDGQKSNLPLLEGRQDVKKLTYFFCRDRVCRLPVTDSDALRVELDNVMKSGKQP